MDSDVAGFVACDHGESLLRRRVCAGIDVLRRGPKSRV